MKKTILASEYNSKKMHIYDVKTKGKHPVHMIDGGSYLTENEEYYCSDECLHEHYTEQEWSEMYEDGGGENYWTEW